MDAKNIKIYQCAECGNILVAIQDAGVIPICCGEEMEVLAAQNDSEKAEKHKPVISTKGDEIVVKIGSVEHPMSSEHYIQWAILTNGRDFQIHYFEPEDEAEVSFAKMNGELCAYAYCNLHGLWSSES